MSTPKIGDINGKWSILFRFLLGCNAIIIPAMGGWAWWVTTMLFTLQFSVNMKTTDRMTMSMFIEVQDALYEKNPDMEWLNAVEVREIQRRNYPYNSKD